MQDEKARFKDMLNSHALKIGEIKRNNEEDVQELIQKHGQKNHEMESSFRQQKNALENQIHELEYKLYPEVIKQIAEGKMNLTEGKVSKS